MSDVRAPGPLRVNLMARTAPRRMSRGMRLAVIILCAALLVVIRSGLGRVSPQAGIAVDLVVHWLAALGSVTVLALSWRAWEHGGISLRWMIFPIVLAAWFLVRAAVETRAVL